MLNKKQAQKLDRAHMDLYKQSPELRRNPERVGKLDDASFEGNWNQYEAELDQLSDGELSEEINRRKTFFDRL